MTATTKGFAVGAVMARAKKYGLQRSGDLIADSKRPSSLKQLFSLAIAAAGIGILPVLPTTETRAQDAAQKGLEIAAAAREADRGFDNYSAELNMVLRNRNGQESQRDLRIKVLEVMGSGNKVIFIFDNPKDVRGTAFLIHSHIQEPDDQWLYLPALRRVKRISSSNRSGSFMGSEFAYEDLTTPEIEKFSYTYLRDEPCGDLTCTVTESVPLTTGSGYSRQLIWHDTETFRRWKVEYYDRKNAHLKTLAYDNYNQYGDFWRAGELNMVNHLTGKGTVMHWNNFDFDTRLNERDFSQTALRRAR